MTTESISQIKIGITGHRRLTAEQMISLEPIIKRAIENIICFHGNKFDSYSDIIFTSPIAKGADTLFVRVAAKYFDGKIRIILPFEKDEYAKDFENPIEREEFYQLLSANKVETICLNSIKDKSRADLYLDAGKKVVDDNDYIIAIWNEVKSDSKGGTSDIVEYAVAKQKNLIVINPDEAFLKLKWYNLPEFFSAELSYYQQFRKEENFVKTLFDSFDKTATKNQKSYASIWHQCFNIGLIAVFLLSFKIAFPLPKITDFILTIVEFALIISIVIKVTIEKRKGFHDNYLKNRFIAERLRLHVLFFDCGYRPKKLISKAIYKSIAEYEKLIPLSLSDKLIQLCSLSYHSVSDKIKAVKSFTQVQQSYHSDRSEKLERKQKQSAVESKILLSFFLLLIFTHIIIDSFEIFEVFSAVTRFIEDHSYIMQIHKFLILFIPVYIAKLEAKKFVYEWERLIGQSKFMLVFLSEITECLDHAANEDDISEILNRLNDNMYIETADWELFMVTKNEIPIA